ncbi:Putative outer membrane protein [Aquicella siphonis]|uniref:Outer membrane protein n=1 Tax=Aquicella siphonis TaxID=254247 RepID=A0A5E4PFJ3_9COXI|nr:outer membrane protein transport protein [Aquicella siphonis]VVC75272.1 Putative outer membrane protein [Aquicella siphonis]
MRRLPLSLLTLLVSSSFMSTSALAAAFQLYELGTPIIGTAGVGQAAVAEDASISYFNPAGMGLLNQSQFMLGAQVLLPYTNFSKNTANTISGGNASNAGMLTPGMDVYYVYQYSPSLKFGVSLTAPYGGSLNYTDGWAGRYIVQDVLFYTLNLNPSIAYRVNNWLSLGAGVAVEYMNLQETVALPIEPLVDGQIDLKLDNFAYGFNLGAMLTPYQSTRIGIAYRSRIKHNLHGSTTFLRVTDEPGTSTQMIMPQNVIVSLAQDLSCQFTLLAELGWSNWSSMQNTILHVDRFSETTPRHWNNTYRAGLGGQFKATPDFTLQAGASFDSSPTNTSHRLPDMPMDRQIRLGVGILYAMMKPVTLGVSYEYMNLGKGDIHNVSSNGVLAGSYSRNYANTVQVSLNVAT